MAKEIKENVFLKVNKQKVDDYNLPGKLRNYILHNDASYVLLNSRGKTVAYYTFKLENRDFQLTHSFFEDKYEDCIDEFEDYILKDMRYKILFRVTNSAKLKKSRIYAGTTPIPAMNQVTLLMVLTAILMYLTNQVLVSFIVGAISILFFAIKIEKENHL